MADLLSTTALASGTVTPEKGVPIPQAKVEIKPGHTRIEWGPTFDFFDVFGHPGRMTTYVAQRYNRMPMLEPEG